MQHSMPGLGPVIPNYQLDLHGPRGHFEIAWHAGHPDGWNIAYYIFTFMRGILFFTVVVLVGTGWSYMKPLLAEKEKRILMIVIPLQVLAEVKRDPGAQAALICC